MPAPAPLLPLSPRAVKFVAIAGAVGLVLSTGAAAVLGTGDLAAVVASVYALVATFGLPSGRGIVEKTGTGREP
jgi:hypothetical protein